MFLHSLARNFRQNTLLEVDFFCQTSRLVANLLLLLSGDVCHTMCTSTCPQKPNSQALLCVHFSPSQQLPFLMMVAMQYHEMHAISPTQALEGSPRAQKVSAYVSVMSASAEARWVPARLVWWAKARMKAWLSGTVVRRDGVTQRMGSWSNWTHAASAYKLHVPFVVRRALPSRFSNATYGRV